MAPNGLVCAEILLNDLLTHPSLVSKVARVACLNTSDAQKLSI